MQKNRLAAAVVLAGAVPFTVLAEQQLETMVVTPSRTAQTADEALAAVSVITREDIERIQPQSVVELLRLQPGIDIGRDGGLGANTSVFLRGTGSSHTLVLIDGVRANSATTGGFAWHNFDPAQIERIEIVRGPRAALYGADAVGGVIQIFTRRPQGVSARAEYGSFDTKRVELGYGGGDRLRYHINASWLETDGFPRREGDTEDHGHENASLTGGIRAPLWGDATLGVTGWLSQTENEFSGGASEGENATLSVDFRDRISRNWHHRISLGYALDDLTNSGGTPEFPWGSEIRTTRYTADWQHDLALTDSYLLIAGVNYREESGRNYDTVAAELAFDERIDNVGAFVSNLFTLGAIDLELSARHDEHSDFGGHTTGQAAAGYQLDPGTRVMISHGTAFKAPDINQLYHPGFGGWWAGNPELEPERSRTTEVSLRHRTGEQHFGVHLFYTDVTDMIASAGENNQSINVDEVRIRGAEFEYALRRGAWDYQANLTLQRARDRADRSPLVRRPDEKLNLLVGYRFLGGANVNVETVLVGPRVDGGNDLPGFGLVNITAGYPITPALSIEGRIENAFDKEYQLVNTYNEPERSYFAGIRYQPGAR